VSEKVATRQTFSSSTGIDQLIPCNDGARYSLFLLFSRSFLESAVIFPLRRGFIRTFGEMTPVSRRRIRTCRDISDRKGLPSSGDSQTLCEEKPLRARHEERGFNCRHWPVPRPFASSIPDPRFGRGPSSDSGWGRIPDRSPRRAVRRPSSAGT
jgi:hypothetical protein